MTLPFIRPLWGCHLQLHVELSGEKSSSVLFSRGGGGGGEGGGGGFVKGGGGGGGGGKGGVSLSLKGGWVTEHYFSIYSRDK